MHPSHHLVSHNPPFPSRAADLLRDGAGAAGRDRGERRAGGRRTVSTLLGACHPGPAGRRDCSSPLLRACCGLRRWTMPGALYCPRCRPHPALTSPRVHRWARGVAPATFRRHRRLRRSARGRRGGVELRSASRPRRDARRRCARCARFRNSSPSAPWGATNPLPLGVACRGLPCYGAVTLRWRWASPTCEDVAAGVTSKRGGGLIQDCERFSVS